jgi:5-methylcytosine-specific restriction protein A
MTSSVAQSWYNSKRWKLYRKHQLAREPFCRMCREEGRAIFATVADHIEPHRDNYRSFYFGELQSLCKVHHDAAKKRMEFRGYNTQVDRFGYPVDPKHPVYDQ